MMGEEREGRQEWAWKAEREDYELGKRKEVSHAYYPGNGGKKRVA
jgi:hypothetical protein